MDYQQIKKTKPFILKNKILTKIRTLLKNYLNATTPEAAEKNFGSFRAEMLKQKKAHPLFDVNQPIGENLSAGGVIYKYYFDIVLHRDDQRLFQLLLECGLQEVNIEGIKILDLLMAHNVKKCLKDFLSIGDYARHFKDGKRSPLEGVIRDNNFPVLKMIVEHPDFKTEYLSHERQVSGLNPFLIAVYNFNFKMTEYLFKRGASFGSTQLPTKAFDLIFVTYLNHYSKGHAIEIMLKQKQGNLLPPVKMMIRENILSMFYLLLNYSPQKFNMNLLIQNKSLHEKRDIFSKLDDLLRCDLRIKDDALRFLGDILGSVGAGLFFHEWPQRLKAKYEKLPASAEIRVPVILPTGIVEQTFYYFADFEAYLDKHHDSFQPLAALHQYLQDKIEILKPEHPNYAKVISLYKKVAHFASTKQSFTTQLTRTKVEQKHNFSLLKSLSEIMLDECKEIIVNKDNLSHLLTERKNAFDLLLKRIPDIDYLLSLEKTENPEVVYCAICIHFTCLPSLYRYLMDLNQICRQLGNLGVYEKDIGLISDSILLFHQIRDKIDFYSMQWLYHALYAQKITPDDTINLTQLMSNMIHLMHKNIRVNHQASYQAAYYRLEYVLQALLVGACLENGNISQAKKAFKNALLILQAVNNPNLFTDAYVTMTHHLVLLKGFLNMMRFGVKYMPDEIYPHLCQMIQYKTGILFGTEEFISNLKIYLQDELKRNHFIQVQALLSLLQENMPQHKKAMLLSINVSMRLQQLEFLALLNSYIDKYGLSSQVKLERSMEYMIVDFQATCLKTPLIKKMLPCDCDVNDKIFTIYFTEFLLEEEMQALFLAIHKINELAAQQKQKQEMHALEAQMASLAVTESLSYTPPYTPYHHYGTGHKPKRPKGLSTIPETKKLSAQENKSATSKIDIAELKKLAGLDEKYSDLIMIYSSYSNNQNKFIAIKDQPEFKPFFNACDLFEDAEGTWAGIKSINPYGNNQHGVKCYKKTGEEKEVLHTAKVKGSGSDRAVGHGKEMYYNGTKIVIYVIDTILPHDKALKIFNFPKK